MSDDRCFFLRTENMSKMEQNRQLDAKAM